MLKSIELPTVALVRSSGASSESEPLAQRISALLDSSDLDAELDREQERLRREFDLRAELIGLGVDRLDYTKGIPERL